MQSSYTNLYTQPSPASAGLSTGLLVFDLALIAFFVVVMWKVFVKAGKPGWAALIPIYNTIVLLEIVGRPWWWILLLLIPFVNIIILFIVDIDLAKAFGKSTTFGVLGLAIFSLIGYPILAFGSSNYVGPGGQASPGPSVAPGVPPTVTPGV
jgi:hypothetical protein